MPGGRLDHQFVLLDGLIESPTPSEGDLEVVPSPSEVRHDLQREPVHLELLLGRVEADLLRLSLGVVAAEEALVVVEVSKDLQIVQHSGADLHLLGSPVEIDENGGSPFPLNGRDRQIRLDSPVNRLLPVARGRLPALARVLGM